MKSAEPVTSKDYNMFDRARTALLHGTPEQRFNMAAIITDHLAQLRSSSETSERPMTLGRLVLETARGNVKERTVSGKELAEIRANMARYFKGPLEFREPLDESGAPYIYDANGNAVAMLMWPGHLVEETAAAEQATYALGRVMAAAIEPNELKASAFQVCLKAAPAQCIRPAGHDGECDSLNGSDQLK